jgi:hypothetical protein
LDFASFTQNKRDGDKTEVLAIAPFNLKYGVGPDTDLQLLVSPYVRAEARAGGVSSDAEGFGDVTLRLKHNFWGNDGGETAFAIMPFLTFPTADDDLGGSDSVEGGVILPLAVALSDSLGAGFMVQINALKDSNDDYAPEFVLSGTLAADLSERIGAYVELYGARFDDTGAKTAATFDFGFTYAVGPELQLDLGTNIGLNEDTDDLQVFAGLSRRW